MPRERSRDSLARPLILPCPRLRSASGCVASWRRLLAEDADEDEDCERAEGREDERGPARDADRQRAVIDVGAEADRPEEGDHAVVDRRGARHVRHMQDSSPRGGRDFHKLQGLLWKCGKLNFCKLRPFRPSDLLRKDLTSPRFPFAPSTERK